MARGEWFGLVALLTFVAWGRQWPYSDVVEH